MEQKELKLRISADSGPLNSALGGSQTKLNEFGATVSRVAKANGLELSSSIQQNVKQLEALRDHLIQINAPASDVAKVTGRISEEQRKLSPALAESSTNAGKFGQSLGSLKTIAGALGLTFGAMAIANLIREWSGAAVDFEKQFANVTTLFDTAKVDAGAMRDEILSLSGSLGSTVDLTQGLYEALSAGVEPAQAVRFVGEAAMFAKAALVDTRTSVDVLTTTVNAYGLSAADAGKISDTLFTTIKLGKITGQELSASLGQVIGVAATTGVKFEELNAAIASLTAGGVKGSEAITALRAIISNVGKPTEDASKAADKLGINFSLAGLKSQGLAGFLAELTQKAKGHTQAQVDLFGSVQAFNAIAILTSETGAKRFNDAMIQIQNSAGATTEAFEKQNATMGAQTEAIWNNLSRLYIKAAGEGRTLTDVLKGLNAVLESKGWGDAWLNFNKLTIQLGFMGSAARQALKDATDHKVMMDAMERSTKRGQDAMHNYALSLLEAGKAQDKAVSEKTAAQLEKEAKAAQAARQAFEAYTKTIGTTDSLKKAFDESVRFFDMLKLRTSNLADLERAADDVRKAYDKWNESQKTAMQRFADMKEPVVSNTAMFEDQSKRVLALAGHFRELDQASHDAMVHSGQSIRTVAGDWVHMLDVIGQTPKILDPANTGIKRTSKEFEDMGKQVSTIFTDMFKGISEALIRWTDFGSSMKKIAQEFGIGVMRILQEAMFKPFYLELSKMFGSPTGTGQAGQGTSAGGAGNGFSLANMFSGLSPAGVFSLGATVGAQTGGTPGLVAGGLGTAVAAGAFAPTGAAGAGAFSSMGAGAMGILSVIPVWGWAALAGLAAAGPLINKFTRRGREKVTATGGPTSPGGYGAEDVSADVWGTVEAVKAGNLTVAEGVAAVKQYWAQYETFLRTNLKDQTVIQRSLDTQRQTLTEGLAAIEAFRQETAKAEMKTKLGSLVQEMLETGVLGQSLIDMVNELGGALGPFRSALQISELETLQSDFAGLRAEIEKMVPAVESMFDTFLKTGEITPELQAKINEFGGSLRTFKEFSYFKGLRETLDGLKESFEGLPDQVAALRLIFTQFNGDLAALDAVASAFKDSLRIPELENLQKGFAGLRAELVRMGGPSEEGMLQNFLQTGEITSELQSKVEELGGSLDSFQRFSQMRGLQENFEQLRSTFTGLPEQINSLRPIFEQVGQNMSALDAAARLPQLRGLRSEFTALQSEVNKLMPATVSWQQHFLKTGEITDEMRQKLGQAGADLSVFNTAASEIQTTGKLSSSTASVVSTELSKMTKGLDEIIAGWEIGIKNSLKEVGDKLDNAVGVSRKALIDQLESLENTLGNEIEDLQTTLETELRNAHIAISAVGNSLNTTFENSRTALLTQLATIDKNLGNTISTLRTDLVTEVNKLTSAILGLKIPDEIHVVVDLPKTTTTEPAEPGVTTATGTRARRVPSLAIGGVIPRTGLAFVHAGETVLPPTMMARLEKVFVELKAPYLDHRPVASVRERKPVMVNQTIHVTADDLAAQRRLLSRLNRELVRQLS
jgi:TP901 family phage tail tape measure protein